MYKEPTLDEIKSVENEVEAFVKKYKLNLEANFDVINDVCSKVGIETFSLSMPKGIDGVIMVGKGSKVIGVSNRISSIDSRFVVAHELAHFIVESKKKDEKDILLAMKDSILHDEKKDDNENRMDLIAAAILVPKELFLRDLEEKKISGISKYEDAKNIAFWKIDDLAKKYNVNPELITRRIFEVLKDAV